MKELELVKKFEGCKLGAYLCPAGIATIGYGNTEYEDGTKVKIGDVISQERAEELLSHILNIFSKGVDKLISVKLNDNQRASLISFAYNVGIGNLKSSTLLRMVNTDPSDHYIKGEFLKWNKAHGKVIDGLTKRRSIEAFTYFS